MLRERSRAQDVRIGLLVVIAAIVASIGSLWIAGMLPLGRGEVHYDVLMDASGGVRRGDRVRVSGVQVGRIEKVHLQPGHESPVRLQVAIDDQLIVTRSAHAHLTSDGLLGSSYLQIDVGKPTDPALPPPGPILGTGGGGINESLAALTDLGQQASELLDQLGGALDRTVVQLESLTARANDLLSEPNVVLVSETLSAFRDLASETRPALTSLLERADRLATRLDDGVDELPAITDEVRRLSAAINRAIGEDGQRLTVVLDEGQDALAALRSTLHEISGDGDLEAAIHDLRAAAANLEALTQRVAEQPWSLIRKSRPRDRRPGDPEDRR